MAFATKLFLVSFTIGWYPLFQDRRICGRSLYGKIAEPGQPGKQTKDASSGFWTVSSRVTKSLESIETSAVAVDTVHVVPLLPILHVNQRGIWRSSSAAQFQKLSVDCFLYHILIE